MIKLIVDGSVWPMRTLEQAGEQMGLAYAKGAHELRVKVVDDFPRSRRERDVTDDEAAIMVAAATAAVRKGVQAHA